jgi:hypothetical protein
MIVQPSTLRISQETSTVHEAEYSVEQENTQLNLTTLSISSNKGQKEGSNSYSINKAVTERECSM